MYENLKIGIMSHAYEDVPFKVHVNHMTLFSYWAKRFNVVFLGIDGLVNAAARNRLVDTAIAYDCTHVLFLDVDHRFSKDFLDLLVTSHESAIVSGLVCRRTYPFLHVGFVKKFGTYFNVNFPNCDEVYDVDACAFGCTLLNLEWIKKLEKPYFRDICTSEDGGKKYNKRSDMVLCARLKEIGGDVRIDSRVSVEHMVPNDFVSPQNRHLWEIFYMELLTQRLMRVEFQVPVYLEAYQIYMEKVWALKVQIGQQLRRKF